MSTTESELEVTDDDIDAISDIIGYHPSAWDCANERALIRAIVEHFRAKPAASAKPVAQWLPIESAPKDGTSILVWATRHNMLQPNNEVHVARYSRGWWSGADTLSYAKYWMPLPAAPGKEG